MTYSAFSETESFLFIAFGCGFTVVIVALGLLIYHLTGCCKRCKKIYPPDPPTTEIMRICGKCGKLRDVFGTGHYHCIVNTTIPYHPTIPNYFVDVNHLKR